MTVATTRTAHTTWTGGLADGSGTVHFDSSGIGTYDVTWPARAEEPGGKTSPEELIGAALSSCYCMAMSHTLGQAGTPPASINAEAQVTFQPGEGITGAHLNVRASVPGLSAADFQSVAAQVKDACPVSKALAGVKITLEAALDE